MLQLVHIPAQHLDSINKQTNKHKQTNIYVAQRSLYTHSLVNGILLGTLLDLFLYLGFLIIACLGRSFRQVVHFAQMC